MQRPATKQSRAANADEKRFIGWIKERCICAACGNDAPVICHHVVGSSYKTIVGARRLMIGHIFCIGLCCNCDSIVTFDGRRKFESIYGKQSALWLRQYDDSPIKFDDDLIVGILNSGK